MKKLAGIVVILILVATTVVGCGDKRPGLPGMTEAEAAEYWETMDEIDRMETEIKSEIDRINGEFDRLNADLDRLLGN